SFSSSCDHRAHRSFPTRRSSDLVAGKTNVAGGRFTAADVYVGSQIDWGMEFGTIAPRPAFEAYVTPLRERGAYKRAKEIDNGLIDRKSTRLNSSHVKISYAVFCL